MAHAAGCSCERVLEFVARLRKEDEMVITNQMSARLWPEFSQHELDYNYLSSTMGGAIPFGLGLALARPEYEIIVVSGDGSLLMNLGCLTSVIASGVANLSIILLDNGSYEVTGGQRTPGSIAQVDYAGLAKSSGFALAEQVEKLETWFELWSTRREHSGPRFYSIVTHSVDPDTPRWSNSRVDIQLQRFRERFRPSCS
jgi:thiamine pyrophosphate-dependent acetolactate synthase large subunit-like protein